MTSYIFIPNYISHHRLHLLIYSQIIDLFHSIAFKLPCYSINDSLIWSNKYFNEIFTKPQCTGDIFQTFRNYFWGEKTQNNIGYICRKREKQQIFKTQRMRSNLKQFPTILLKLLTFVIPISQRWIFVFL